MKKIYVNRINLRKALELFSGFRFHLDFIAMLCLFLLFNENSNFSQERCNFLKIVVVAKSYPNFSKKFLCLRELLGKFVN